MKTIHKQEETVGLQMKRCSICKKLFIPAAQHLYRIGFKWQCCYTCYQKAGGDGGTAEARERRQQKCFLNRYIHS